MGTRHRRIVVGVAAIASLGLLVAVAGAATCEQSEFIGVGQTVTASSVSAREGDLVWNGAGYGTVWKDLRDGNNEVYFAVLDRHGERVTAEIRITNDPGSSHRVGLCWTGSAYGVVWRDDRDPGPDNREIYLAVLDADGVKQTGDIRVSTTSLLSTNPVIAWTGAAFGVVWADLGEVSGNVEIYYRAYDALGQPLGDAVPVTSTALESNLPAIAWNGAEFGLAWQDSVSGDREIWFARLDPAGAVLSGPTPISGDPARSEAPEIAWNGDGWGIVWSDRRHDGGLPELYFRGVDAAGNPTTGEQRLTDLPGSSINPRIAWNGTEYAVAWQNDAPGEVRIARVSTGGEVLDTPLPVAAGQVEWPVVVRNGTGFGLSWTADDQIVFRGLGCNCTDGDGDGFTSCTDCNDGDPLAYPGALELCDAVDQDCSGQPDDVEGCTTTCASPGLATILDPGMPFDLVAWNGQGFGVIDVDYEESATHRFARLDAGGHLLAPAVTVPGAEPAQLVWTGSEYGYLSLEPGEPASLVRLTASGEPIGDPIVVSADVYDFDFLGAHDFRLVWAGDGYALFWNYNECDPCFGCSCSVNEIRFRRLDAQGQPSSPGRTIFRSSDLNDEILDFYQILELAVTHSPTGYGILTEVTYTVQDGPPLGYVWTVFLAVDPSGESAQAPRAVGGGEASAWYADLTWNGSGYPYALAEWPYECLTFEIPPDTYAYPSQCTEGGLSVGDVVWTGFEYGIVWGSLEGGVRLSRVDVTGAQIANDIRVPGGRLFWTGTGYALFDSQWQRVSTVACDCVDGDGDGYSCWCEDNARVDADDSGDDHDADGVHDLCDNCRRWANPGQSDGNGDLEGDRCDLDDGLIYLLFRERDLLEWNEAGFDAWNVYRGDLAVLRESGEYTQWPSEGGGRADQFCGIEAYQEINMGAWAYLPQEVVPALEPGEAVFYLVTGVNDASGIESGLGQDSAGNERPNTHPCP